MYTCELLSVGTELLLGDILDTNAQYLSRRLAEMGIGVLHRQTVGDNPARLRQAFLDALSRSDIVLATGGLGPTADDITRDVACEVMGFALVQDAAIADTIRAFFTGRGSEMPESNLRQAMVPQGGTVFENTCGTAPGMALERDGKCVILLPGPPREMKEMFTRSVQPFLQKYTGGVLVSHSVRTMEIGESAMAEAVGDLLENENPTVAPYAKDGEALLRVTALAETSEQAEQLCAPVLSEIRRRLGDKIYGLDVDGIQYRVVELLKEKGLTVAFAESCTAGYIAKRLTEVPGASAVFALGAVTYSNEMKQKLLGVNAETLAADTEFSPQVAAQMAVGVRRLSGADFGVSITGVAGPGAENGCPAGRSFIGLCDQDGVMTEQIDSGHDEREYNRYTAASRALNLLRKRLEKR